MTLKSETLLYRQVHPSWVQNGGVSNQAFVTSQTFKPTPKDQNKLSMYDGDQYSAQESYEHYSEKLTSAGVLGVTVKEFQLEELPCESDDVTFQGHVLVDYGDHTKGTIERKSKKIRDIAIQRGWVYIP
ncbi:hypothetical protein [Chitinophaga sp. sic0106]|uniref:hypothetical protein n=1 Tax=Chitinophaga sp. sic0106 TaxID=2854785 RepID=UPI001C44F31C|nr:hypothetical protein [Chitinophaga sp. sic0106]MBV7530606.1 hypothetical protein [Chitinophaga sp. sic0106]